jgi:hypothetical protein
VPDLEIDMRLGWLLGFSLLATLACGGAGKKDNDDPADDTGSGSGSGDADTDADSDTDSDADADTDTDVDAGGPWVYVADYGNNRVFRVDVAADTIEMLFEDARLSTPRGLALDDDGYLYVAQQANRGVVRFTTDGTYVDQFLAGPYGSYGPGLLRYHDGELLLAGDTSDSGSIYRYNVTTGALVSSFHYPGTTTVMGLGIDGDYVLATGYFADNIVRYDISSTTATSTQLATGLSDRCQGIARGHNGNLFVGDADGTELVEYDGTTGARVGTFATFSGGQQDLWYDDVSNTYFVTRGPSVFQLDTAGAVLHEWTDPNLTNATGMAVTYTEW